MIIIDNQAYEVIPDVEYNEYETDIEIAQRTAKRFASATHWLCEKSDKEEGTEKGKLYPFSLYKINEECSEYCIQINEEYISMAWLVIEGKLLKKI